MKQLAYAASGAYQVAASGAKGQYFTSLNTIIAYIKSYKRVKQPETSDPNTPVGSESYI